jgi:hypothetical protein
MSKTKIVGVIHGKRGAYFRNRLGLLEGLLGMGNLELHCTLHPSQMEGVTLPVGLKNHFHLDSASFLRMLGSAHFVLGLGDPVLGPTALQAIASGTPSLLGLCDVRVCVT